MIATHFLIQILQTITARAHGNTLNESTNRYTKYKDCQGTHSKIKETENKTWSGGCSTNRSYCKNLKTKPNTPGPGVIAQWTGTPGPQAGSGLKVQTPVEKSLWPSVTELDWGVPMACQVGSAMVLPKTRTSPHITLKIILQTLTTRVWVI
jgi:hypothetical protein